MEILGDYPFDTVWTMGYSLEDRLAKSSQSVKEQGRRV